MVSERKAAKKAAYQEAQRHGSAVQGVWVDEAPATPAPRDAEKDEARVQEAVLEAMRRAARAGLGNRGRIRAGQRALRREQAAIEKEQER